jgi:hypothetical protein
MATHGQSCPSLIKWAGALARTHRLRRLNTDPMSSLATVWKLGTYFMVRGVDTRAAYEVSNPITNSREVIQGGISVNTDIKPRHF